MRARISAWLGSLVVTAATVLTWSPALAEPGADDQEAHPGRRWTTHSALTVERGRLELGALSGATYGLTERVELRAHPVGLFVFPSLRANVNWWSAYSKGLCPCRISSRAWWFSTGHRLFAPAPFLGLIAKEGSGGLLPANTEIPFSVGLMNEALITRDLLGHLWTLSAGLSVLAGRSDDLPMVEFPFLYSTLASLYSPFVVHMGLSVEGTIWGPLDYEVVPRMVLFRPDEDIPWPGDDTPMAFSQETKMGLHLRLGTRHRLSAGGAMVIARYPIGTRSFLVPTLDYRAALF